MSSLSLKHIYKVYPSGVIAVSDFNLEIEDKEFVVLVGPSGCGKSTTLRMIAGLEDISAGELYIGENLVNNTPPKDRDIAMVFQNYALYPHMSVYDNMAFGLKLRKTPKAEIDRRVKEAARILGLEMYLSRKPKALSGGQRQRVALGRAIVREPKVFLLDEPLSNLDAKLRAQMRTEITKLHNRLATTFIYVTHDQVEAMTMGTRIVVMKDGYTQQVDTPIALYNYPNNQFVAGFIGSPQMNFYPGKITKEDKKVFVEFDSYKVELPKEKIDLLVNADLYYNTDKPIIFGIRPEDMYDMPNIVNSPKAVTIDVTVDVVERLGAESLLYCKTAGHKANALTSDTEALNVEEDAPNLIAKVDARSTSNNGDKIKLALDMTRCQIFDGVSELTILARDKESKASIEALHVENIKVQEYAKEVAEKKAQEEAEAAALAEAEAAKKAAKKSKKAKAEDAE